MHARQRANGATALRGGPIMVHPNGAPTRSFCHVDDMVEPVTGLDEGLPRTIEYPLEL